MPLSAWGSPDDASGSAAAHESRRLDVLQINRGLLAAFYGSLIRDKSTVYSATVLHEDQATRLRWLLGSMLVFAAGALLMDLNASSLHGFYSTQIGRAWIEPISPYGRHIPLVDLTTTDIGEPYHLVNGTVQLFNKHAGTRPLRQDGFLFSQRYCGSPSLGYRKTQEYMGGHYELDNAIAVSGAAVSPTLSNNPLILLLLTLANMRLGQWLENPGAIHKRRGGLPWLRRWPITPIRLLWNWSRPPRARSICFVTDGGHYENLGLEPLLLRRCRFIIAMDASQDEQYCFADFTALIRRMRILVLGRRTTCARRAGPAIASRSQGWAVRRPGAWRGALQTPGSRRQN
jgi:hypothetical protein